MPNRWSFQSHEAWRAWPEDEGSTNILECEGMGGKGCAQSRKAWLALLESGQFGAILNYNSSTKHCPVRAGDQSGNLLWRIMSGGEWPTQHMPKTVVILIGTNDLSYADCNDDEQEILDAATGIISRCASLWMI